MPNRILRDWTDSFMIDALSPKAEVFFTRLIMKVDDYGRFYADVRLLHANLFPLKADYRNADIAAWLNECKAARLIAVYTVASKEYLQITNFKQQLRQKNERFPAPEKGCVNDATQLHSNSTAIAPLKRTRNEVETETECSKFSFENFWNAYGKKVDKVKCEKKWLKISETEKEKISGALNVYVESTPDVQFRKNPLTWLNGQCWNDEILKNNTNGNTQRSPKPGISAGRTIVFDKP